MTVGLDLSRTRPHFVIRDTSFVPRLSEGLVQEVIVNHSSPNSERIILMVDSCVHSVDSDFQKPVDCYRGDISMCADGGQRNTHIARAEPTYAAQSYAQAKIMR